MSDTMPTHASLLFPAEDGIELPQLIEILEQLQSTHYSGSLPPRITGLNMTDHVLRIELAR